MFVTSPVFVVYFSMKPQEKSVPKLTSIITKAVEVNQKWCLTRKQLLRELCAMYLKFYCKVLPHLFGFSKFYLRVNVSFCFFAVGVICM